jgi:glucosyl-dolichyl phosphate glucuronosyltransferase
MFRASKDARNADQWLDRTLHERSAVIRPHQPDVSVVISTHNRCALLGRALDCLIHQQVPLGLEYEIIVVDNDSTDDTRRTVDAFSVASGNLTYVREPRLGVSYGRNTGIRSARAPIIAFTDDDNVVDDRWVATIKALMDAHPDASAVGGPIRAEWPADVPAWLDRQHWGPLAILDYGNEKFDTCAQDPRCLLTANLAFRREVFDRIGGFAEDFARCQDHELLVRLWRAGGHALYAPELVVGAIIPRERLTRRYHRKWHVRHGHFSAQMRNEELLAPGGGLRAEPLTGPYLFGVPPHVYAELIRTVWRSVTWLGRRKYSVALARWYHGVYLAAYIRHTVARQHPTARQVVADPFRVVVAQLRRHAASVHLSPARVLFVDLLLALLIGGSFYDIYTGREHWPVSPYPMFSIVEREPSLRCLRIVGVSAGAGGQEIILLDSDLIAPFDQCRLTSALSRTYSDEARRPRIHEQLRDCLDRYEQRRRAGLHDGAPLDGVRLYEMRWTLQPDASNVSTPDSRQLIDAVYHTPAHTAF